MDVSKSVPRRHRTYSDWAASNAALGGTAIARHPGSDMKASTTFSAANLYSNAEATPASLSTNMSSTLNENNGTAASADPLQYLHTSLEPSECKLCAKPVVGQNSYRSPLCMHLESGHLGAQEALDDIHRQAFPDTRGFFPDLTSNPQYCERNLSLPPCEPHWRADEGDHGFFQRPLAQSLRFIAPRYEPFGQKTYDPSDEGANKEIYTENIDFRTDFSGKRKTRHDKT